MIMGCPHSVDTKDSIVHDADQSSKSLKSIAHRPSAHRRSTMCTMGAAVLIQKWYRRHRARLEARRRCAWMIYQSLEYSNEQGHLKLYQLYNDLITNADNQKEMSKSPNHKVIYGNVKGVPLNSRRKNEDIWNDNLLPPITSHYQGPHLAFPLDMAQVNDMMIAFTQSKRYNARYIFQLLNEARQVLSLRPNIQRASTSISRQITIVGDLHGHYADLCTIFHKNGMPDVTNPYLFNGDFVDRGRLSLETLVLILALMIVRPTAVFLNRGNHEDHYLNCQYGFIRELQKKYRSSAGPLVKCFSDIYSYLPMATIIDDHIFVCHGGISDKTDVQMLDSMDRLSFHTFMKPPSKGNEYMEAKEQFQDLLWSDPHSTPGVSMNDQRGLGCFYGPDTSRDFLKKNGFKLLIRSHECKSEGFEWSHDGCLLTVFSASNYYTEGSNKGAYCRISPDGSVELFQYLSTAGKKQKTMRQRLVFYFCGIPLTI
ncbi:Serine/threonine-protein phosphatase rdgC [Fasciola gigantica]|uniref:Serine/threonine-protein phosphatase n=1 Tax=Fasciola gigantica TaxID=46835 RepID=A0A504YQ70_FASGI|nr:Serine/threonine-protein phosphatase rdgC [Fasciola gigantica]